MYTDYSGGAQMTKDDIIRFIEMHPECSEILLGLVDDSSDDAVREAAITISTKIAHINREREPLSRALAFLIRNYPKKGE